MWKSLLPSMILALQEQERSNLDMLTCPIGLSKHCQDKVRMSVKKVFGELSLEFQAVWSLPLALPLEVRLHVEKNNSRVPIL